MKKTKNDNKSVYVEHNFLLMSKQNLTTSMTVSYEVLKSVFSVAARGRKTSKA